MLWCAWICEMKYFWKYRMRILFAAWKNLQEKKNNHHYTVMRSSKRMSGNKILSSPSPFTYLYNHAKCNKTSTLCSCCTCTSYYMNMWFIFKSCGFTEISLAYSVKLMKFINVHIYTLKVPLWLNYDKDWIFFF